LTVMAAGKIIQISDLPAELKNEPISESDISSGNWKEQLAKEIARGLIVGDKNIYEEYISQVESILIKEALKSTKNRKIDAAKALGIGRNTITRKIKDF